VGGVPLTVAGNSRARRLNNSRSTHQLGVGAAAHADAAVEWREPRHAHEDVTLQKLGQDDLGERGVAAAVDRHKVGRAG
jgi:hypothetical protein